MHLLKRNIKERLCTAMSHVQRSDPHTRTTVAEGLRRIRNPYYITTTIIMDLSHGVLDHLTFDCDGGQGLLAAQYVKALADVLTLVLVLYVTDT